ncbi:hypothetical protein IQ260_21620 [Leptolyngbya cf. ectocarpi LEGE 11479]|uniref:Uncharacterized protein n=1 Tax=Leptolyngbya cf. ectocarpi LEGE 11479 TaxID=1828722 RepID=A0A929F8D8_LEPEC|nr:hypothetical protein [Leptolyngbya ectocarpi]MBE9069245.1 hypothetical protein [Leptolyngbya cf. ectocarpi LEGE 11479]
MGLYPLLVNHFSCLAGFSESTDKRTESELVMAAPMTVASVQTMSKHSCLTLIELTDRCNLTCPICYADSGVEILAVVI